MSIRITALALFSRIPGRLAPIAAALAVAAALASSDVSIAQGLRTWQGEITIANPARAAAIAMAQTSPLQFAIDDQFGVTGTVFLRAAASPGEGFRGLLNGRIASVDFNLTTTLEPTTQFTGSGNAAVDAWTQRQTQIPLTLTGFLSVTSTGGTVNNGRGTLNFVDMRCVLDRVLAAGRPGFTPVLTDCPRQNVPITWKATGPGYAVGQIAGDDPAARNAIQRADNQARENRIPAGSRVKIVRVVGEVEIQPGGTGANVPLNPNSSFLGKNDIIVTGLGGSITLQMPNGELVTMDEVSSGTITQLAPQDPRTRLWLKAGQVSAELRGRQTGTSDFAVELGEAVCGPRGTRFTIRRVEGPPALTTIRVTEGNVEVVPTNRNIRAVLMQPGSEVRVSATQLTGTGNFSPILPGTVTQYGPVAAAQQANPFAPAQPAAQSFPIGGKVTLNQPQINGIPLDWCVNWGVNCGSPAADNYCRSQGYARSIGFSTYAPGRTYVLGDRRTCDNNTCGAFMHIDCERGLTAAPVSTDFRNLLVSTPFEWIDNGRSIGTITFAPDGTGRATWINVSQAWRVDPNGNLMIYADGTRWVVRMIFDSATNSFSGARDVTSQTQDGVQTLMRPVSLQQAQPALGQRFGALRARLSADNYARLYADASVLLARHGSTVGWINGMDPTAPPNDPGRGVTDWNAHYGHAQGNAPTVAAAITARLGELRVRMQPNAYAQMEAELAGLVIRYGG